MWLSRVLCLVAVLPKIEAIQCGAADALMLDSDGYVSETNATNVFMVKRGVVHTPSPDYCLPGRGWNLFVSIHCSVSFIFKK